jgi:hypothetical protein
VIYSLTTSTRLMHRMAWSFSNRNILWIKQYDDNEGKWEKPFAIARCPWKGLAGGDAAMTLLAAVLREEQRRYDSDWGRFYINDTGLLSMEELDAVADAVWGDREKNEAQAIE